MKSLLSNFLILTVFTSLFLSCKKDNDVLPDYFSTLKGNWKFLKGENGDKYLWIYDSRTFSILSSDKQGIRGRSDGTMLVLENQLVIDKTINESATEIYNYALHGDTLSLTQPSVKLTLIRDATAPDTSQWIKSLSIAVKTKAPINDLTDITFDGSFLWYGNAYATNYLYKINITDFAVDSIPTSESAWAVEASGNSLWVSDDGTDKIYKVDKSTGASTFTSTALGSWIYGIARDNGYLWCYSNNENTLYKYDTTANSVELTTPIDSRWEGLAMANNHLYVACNGILHKCSLSPLMGIESFQLPGYYIYGVAYDGSDFWVSASKLVDNAQPEIIKLSGTD
jgi:hypothetical protein